jgi:Domain of unknown function (DUF3472)/Domain of unknown function (DUF5077)
MIRALILLFLTLPTARAELRVPGCTAYGAPDFDAIRMHRERGVINWTEPKQSVLWFGEIRKTGTLDVALLVHLPGTISDANSVKLKLTIAGRSAEANVTGAGEVPVKFGAFEIPAAGYQKFTLESPNPAGEIKALILNGSAAEGAHFNTDPRRNAASVHLFYPVPDNSEVTAFYCEATGLEDPVYTYYMATGFSRGYFGMQVNSPTERRIIFSVWDAAEGQNAKDRSTVKEENHTKLLSRGEGVHASVFGNEGTGGHSHLKHPWKTGEPQKFAVTAKPDGTFTDYSGFWFHPDKNAWVLIASFRAPKDGKFLRGLYSFSENFGGSNGHLVRKARFGNQWIQTRDGAWTELTKASFSHDGTGREARRDRFMGVEQGQFFLSHGGFVEGFTKFGEVFTRPAGGKAPVIEFPRTP